MKERERERDSGKRGLQFLQGSRKHTILFERQSGLKGSSTEMVE